MADDVNDFSKLAFLMVRRVFPSLIANELVKVQPMTQPSSSIFTMDFDKKPAMMWVCKWFWNNVSYTSNPESKQDAYDRMIKHLKEKTCAWIEPVRNE